MRLQRDHAGETGRYWVDSHTILREFLLTVDNGAHGDKILFANQIVNCKPAAENLHKHSGYSDSKILNGNHKVAF